MKCLLVKHTHTHTLSLPSVCGDNVKSILLDSSHKKLSRDNLLFATLDDLTKQVGESHPSISEKHIGDTFWGHVTKEAMRSVVLDNQTR